MEMNQKLISVEKIESIFQENIEEQANDFFIEESELHLMICNENGQWHSIFADWF